MSVCFGGGGGCWQRQPRGLLWWICIHGRRREGRGEGGEGGDGEKKEEKKMCGQRNRTPT